LHSGFYLQDDLDLLADHNAIAARDGAVEADAEVRAVDLAGGGEAGEGTAMPQREPSEVIGDPCGRAR
jgi:hypothetical protein